MANVDSQDEWQKSFMDEARQIVKQSKEDYGQMVRMSNIVTAKFCEVGGHKTNSKLTFCNNCKLSFCEKHGDAKKMLCQNCQSLSFGFK